jgi:hypothetical protein
MKPLRSRHPRKQWLRKMRKVYYWRSLPITSCNNLFINLPEEAKVEVKAVDASKEEQELEEEVLQEPESKRAPALPRESYYYSAEDEAAARQEVSHDNSIAPSPNRKRGPRVVMWLRSERQRLRLWRAA